VEIRHFGAKMVDDAGVAIEKSALVDMLGISMSSRPPVAFGRILGMGDRCA